ncbi:MAG: hypothetical protein ABSA57_19560 [Candidatus Acidiferrales bacterium]|jgi:hypothetical protein
MKNLAKLKIIANTPDAKYKELLAVAFKTQCPNGIEVHRSLPRQARVVATDQEISEALFVPPRCALEPPSRSARMPSKPRNKPSRREQPWLGPGSESAAAPAPGVPSCAFLERREKPGAVGLGWERLPPAYTTNVERCSNRW